MTARDGIKHSEQRYEGRCEWCGKFAFPTRKSAKRYMQNHFPGQPMSVYKCRGAGWYHYGHTPNKVVQGDKARSEVKTRKKDWM